MLERINEESLKPDGENFLIPYTAYTEGGPTIMDDVNCQSHFTHIDARNGVPRKDVSTFSENGLSNHSEENLESDRDTSYLASGSIIMNDVN